MVKKYKLIFLKIYNDKEKFCAKYFTVKKIDRNVK